MAGIGRPARRSLSSQARSDAWPTGANVPGRISRISRVGAWPTYASASIISWPFQPLYGFSRKWRCGDGGWWAHQDLNLEPTDYESAALTN